MEKNKEDILSNIYNDLTHPASFGTAKQLYDSCKKEGITLSETKSWLNQQLSHSLHKPKRKTYKRNPTLAICKDDLWQCDLVDMSRFKTSNSGFRYIFTIIDVFSKYAWAFSVKNKKPELIIGGFKKILSLRRLSNLQTDQGTEFGARFSMFLQKYSINYYTTRNTETKCAVVERFNRTLRSRMFKYFTAKGTRKYINVLNDLVISYNNRIHSSIGMKPSSVKSEHTKKIFKKLYGENSKRSLLKKLYGKTVLIVGDQVRVSYMSNPLDKGYYPNWTDEVFEVSEAINDVKRPQYRINDSTGQTLQGRFYPEEIQKVEGDRFRVKILKKRTKGGVKEAYVSWLNYPTTANSWVPWSSVGDI